MRRFAVVTAVTAGILVLVVGLLLAQGRGGGTPGTPPGGGPGGITPADRMARDLERMRQLLTEAGLIGSERVAAEAAVRAKLEARQELTAALTELRIVSEDPNATDEALNEAIAAYQNALTKYRGVVEAQDNALIAKLSARSQARCLDLGVVENGFGMSFRRPGGPGGRGG